MLFVAVGRPHLDYSRGRTILHRQQTLLNHSFNEWFRYIMRGPAAFLQRALSQFISFHRVSLFFTSTKHLHELHVPHLLNEVECPGLFDPEEGLDLGIGDLTMLGDEG